MKKIGLFYGSSTCYTEFAAEKIRDAFPNGSVELHDVSKSPLPLANNYDSLIFGTPTWDYGELQEDWEQIWPEIAELTLSGKAVALYGLGDAVGYAEWFQDAMGYLYHALVKQGAAPIGSFPVSGFEFDDSKALNASKTHFVGLSLDEENQPELSDQRIQEWVASIRDKMLGTST